MRISFLNCAPFEKAVGYNKEITGIKKYHIVKHLNCLLTYVNTHVLSNVECT